MGLARLIGNATTLVITIGSHVAPVLPPPNGVAIAFEPVVHSLIKPHPNLYVVPAAVAAESGLASMERYGGKHGSQSSSLSEAAYAAYWNKHIAAEPLAVPIVSMKGLLNSLPPAANLTLHAMKTDMQGHDYAALSSAGPLLTRVHWLLTEVWLRGRDAYKTPVGNDFCSQHMPHMLSIGFELVALRGTVGVPGRPYLARSTAAGIKFCDKEREAKPPTGHREANALWRQNTTTLPAPKLPNWDLGNR